MWRQSCFRVFSPLKVWTKVHIFLVFLVYVWSSSFWFHNAIVQTKQNKTIHDVPTSCRHHLRELCLPIPVTDWFVEGRASDVGMLSVQRVAFYRTLNDWRKMNEHSHFVAAIIIIIKHLVSSSPRAIVPHFVLLHCFSFFPGTDDSLPELPVIGLKVWTIQKVVLNARNKPNHGSVWFRPRPTLLGGLRFSCMVQTVVQWRFHTCNFGSEQTKKSEIPDQIG